MSKMLTLAVKFTLATVSIVRYNDTMQLEEVTEEVRFEGHMDQVKASKKAIAKFATRNQIAVVKSVLWYTAKYTMTHEAFKAVANMDVEENFSPIESV